MWKPERPQKGANSIFIVFPYHLSTIADFIDMRYNYSMEKVLMKKVQDMSHDTLVSLS